MKQNDTLSFNVMKYNQFSDEPLNVSEIDFWTYYLDILEVRAGSFLSDIEKKVMAYVLAGVPGKSYFKKPASTELMEVFDIKVNNFHRIKYSLEEKGIIIPTEIRGDYILSKKFDGYQKGMKKFLKEGKTIEYKFKFKLDERRDKESNTRVEEEKANS